MMRTKGKCKRECSPLEIWLQDCIERLFDKFMVRRDAIMSSTVAMGLLALLGYYCALVSLWMKSPYEITIMLLIVVLFAPKRRPVQ